jgi:uncharacterized protein (TIGR02646 family)
MIRIERLQLPTKPISKEEQQKRKKGNIFKYNEDSIVRKLWKMQYEKCCYCENKIPLKGHSKAVEHFVPKSIVKKLTNDWENLLLACAQCNGKKSDKFPLALFKVDVPDAKVIYLKKAKDLTAGSPLLINPTKENPEEFLDFICDLSETDFGLILPKENKNKGIFTIKTIGLYDKHYTNIHRDFIRDVLLNFYNKLTKAADNKDIEGIELHKKDFEQIMRSNYKLAGLARSFARYYKLDRYQIGIPGL